MELNCQRIDDRPLQYNHYCVLFDRRACTETFENAECHRDHRLSGGYANGSKSYVVREQYASFVSSTPSTCTSFEERHEVTFCVGMIMSSHFILSE